MNEEEVIQEKEVVYEIKSEKPKELPKFNANKKITPRIVKTIVYYRTSKDMTWDGIAEAISKKYDIKVNDQEIKKAYDEEAARASVESPKGQKMFNQQINEMEERFEAIWKTADRLHKAADKLLDEFEAKSENEMQAYINFLKVAPTILMITKQIKELIEFISNQQKKNEINQKNYIYSPMQIMMQLNPVLKVLSKESIITINDPSKFEDFFKKGVKK